MARLVSQLKMGFYPCPPIAERLIAQMLRAENKNVHILDPCSGEGHALSVFASRLSSQAKKVVTYGVELDPQRAVRSEAVLDKTLQCSIFDLICSRHSFSSIMLNPPYDWDHRVVNRPTRLEKTFFKEVVEYLAPKGILVFLLPESTLDSYLARGITYRFENIIAFKLPPGEFERFHQVVLFGTRKEKYSYDEPTATSLLNSINDCPFLTQEVANELHYQLPETNGPTVFADKHPTLSEAMKELKESPLNHFAEILFSAPLTITNTKPLMPLRLAHIASLLTAGLMDGVVAKGKEIIVVKGYTEQITETRTERIDSSTVKQIEIKKAKASVRYFDSKGTLFEVK